MSVFGSVIGNALELLVRKMKMDGFDARILAFVRKRYYSFSFFILIFAFKKLLP